MAKTTKTTARDRAKGAPKHRVSLPAPPEGVGLEGFVTATVKRGDKSVRVMRPSSRAGAAPLLVRDTIHEETVSPAGDYIARRAKVWRVADRRAWACLPPDAKAALIDYAETVAAVGASGGTSDPMSAGGTAPGSRAPATRKLEAAERLRRMRAALEGGTLDVVLHSRPPRPAAAYSLPLTDLVDWVGVEYLSKTAVLRRMGVPNAPSAAGNRPGDCVAAALYEAAMRLHHVAIEMDCGPKAARARNGSRTEA